MMHACPVQVALLSVTAMGLPASADTVFHTWIEAPAEVVAGDTFTISVWTSLGGSIPKPNSVAFAGYVIDLSATGLSVEFSKAFNSDLPVFLEGTPDDNALRIVNGGQFAFNAPQLIWDNPIRLFDAHVMVVAGQTGFLTIDPFPSSGFSSTVSWYTAVPAHDSIFDDDPGSTRIITPATIRVIPAPGAAAILTLSALAFARR